MSEIGWTSEHSVAVIAAYLAFFPVAVGALRGLKSPTSAQLDLMRAYGVGWWRSLLPLRFPASLPFLLPALRLAAASAVIGTVVAEGRWISGRRRVLVAESRLIDPEGEEIGRGTGTFQRSRISLSSLSGYAEAIR